MIFFSPPKHDPYLKTIIIYVKSNCNIVMNKKYIYGLSDDQDIFLIYIWSSSRVPGSAPKTLGVSQVWRGFRCLCYVNEATFGPPPKDGGCLSREPVL